MESSGPKACSGLVVSENLVFSCNTRRQAANAKIISVLATTLPEPSIECIFLKQSVDIPGCLLDDGTLLRLIVCEGRG
jgi:hypothetical protein